MRQILTYDDDGNLEIAEAYADFNGDGVIDGDDEQMILDVYGKCDPSPLYNPDLDLNDDGCIDSKDYELWKPYNGTSPDMIQARYVWNAENRLIELKPIRLDKYVMKYAYKYDHRGRRVERICEDYSCGW